MKASFSGIELASACTNINVVVDDAIVPYVFHIAEDMRVSTFLQVLTTCVIPI